VSHISGILKQFAIVRKKTRQKSPFGKHSRIPQPMKGTLEITRSGIGYVVIGDGKDDILVRPAHFNTALNGDEVIVKVTKENERSLKREGKIVEVKARKQTEFVGRLQLSSNYAFFIADTDKPMPDFYIPLENVKGAKDKDKVVVRLVKWGGEEKKPIGEVVRVMNQEKANDAAMQE